ncbi:PAS domain-containing sensor histidine kinase [Taibaiella soli]|nr:PAS domain S-box protein [Taibaiella soli]
MLSTEFRDLPDYELLQEVVNMINEGLIIKDLNGQIITFNQQALNLLDLPAEQCRGKNCADLFISFCHSDLRLYEFEEVPSVVTMRTGKAVQDAVIGIKTEKALNWVSLSSKVISIGGTPYVLISFFDISNIIEANRKLAEKERHLQLIVSSIDDMVFEITAGGNILNYWTNDTQQLFYNPDFFLDRNIGELFPPELSKPFLELITKSLQENMPCGMEYQSPFDSHKDSWYYMHVRPIHTLEGKVAVVISDITEERKTQQKLAEMDRRWKFVLESSGQALWDFDFPTRSVYYTDVWKTMLGYNPDEIGMGRNEWESRVHPEDVKLMNDAVQLHVEGKIPYCEVEHRLMHKDGAYRWILSKSVITERDVAGNPLRMLGINMDITERIHNMEQIRISEQKFNQAFQYSAIGMALVEMDGHCMEVNETFCKMLGYTAEELRSMTFHQFTHPDDLSEDVANMDKLVKGEFRSYTLEKRYIHKQGHFIWSLLTVSLVRDSNGEPIFCIGQVQDISASKVLIDALARQNAQLELTTLDLEQKINQLEEFNQIVAHNLRSPAGNIQMLIHEIENATSEADRDEYLDLLKLSSTALIETLQELIDILEIRVNNCLPFESCHFTDITDKVIKQLLAGIQHKNASVVTNFGVQDIFYPKVYLESIIQNLVSNALKYSSPERPPQINIETYLHKGTVCLSVRDNGLGIDLNKYGSQIFKFRKIFHRGFDSRGVGLFMTRNQIETLGGKITVESEPDIGTTFTIKF